MSCIIIGAIKVPQCTGGTKSISFTTRYVFNTYYLYLTKFDEIPLQQMKMLVNDLIIEFLNWRNNRYYKELSMKTRLKHLFISKFPVQYAKFYIYQTRMISFMGWMDSRIIEKIGGLNE